MNVKEITPGIHYVGVNDRTTHRFEAMWPIPLGVSYNSYIIKGSSKSALVDGVEISECDRLRDNITNLLGPDSAPDYLIINHMEPDHSGAIKVLRSYYPDMTIVGNTKTLGMVAGFYGITDNVMDVADGDIIDLGGLTARFALTPMVHWPETMMTFVEERGVLFSGDAFGCFGALSGGIVDNETDIEPFIPEMYRYYSNIVGKYGIFVQKALAKLNGFNLKYVCPTHGPVWHSHLSQVIDIYSRLSKYEGEKGVTIVYGSMYGHTEEMAEAIASELSARGIKHIKMHNAGKSHLSYILSDIFRYRGLIIGSPTYSNTVFPPVMNVLEAIKTRELKNRVTATFGSHTWAPGITKRIDTLLSEIKLPCDTTPTVEAKQQPTAQKLSECRILANAVADRL